MKKLHSIAALTLAASLMIAALAPGGATAEAPSAPTPAARTQPGQIQEPTESFTANSTNMSFAMLRQLRKEEGKANLVFSPLGVQYMLGMLNGAADSKTHQAINKAWGYDAATGAEVLDKELQNKMQWLNASASYAPEGTRFDIANAVFLKSGYGLSKSFGKSMTDYQARASELDFTDKKAIDTINKWASEKTNGRIPSIVEGFEEPKLTRLVLLNAVNMEARWENEFRPGNTKKETFYGSGGKSQVDMMRGGLEYGRYYRDDDVEFTTRQLQGGFDFFLLVPRSSKAGALDAAIAKLDSKALAKMRAGSDTDKVKYEGSLYLPRFSIDYKPENLIGTLKGLGLDLQAKGANFDKAAATPEKDPLVLSQIQHRARIDVNEEGVSASAVTMGEMAVGEAMETRKIVRVEMKANRPFLYGILDSDGGILFLGTAENLSA